MGRLSTGWVARRAGSLGRAALAVVAGAALGVGVAVGVGQGGASWWSPASAASDARSPEERSIRERVAARIAAAIDASNPTTRNLAVRLAAQSDGPFRVEQVARIWSHVRSHWRYVSDPRGGEYFARASETIDDGLAGDCDDFATVLIAMSQAIGGRGRLVMIDGDDGGHAYAEVCIEASPEEVSQHLAAVYADAAPSERQAVADIHFRSDPECPVWLGLDWSAPTPGGPYHQERWAVAIHADGHTETLTPSPGAHPGDPSRADDTHVGAGPPP
jgi:hypothetical protein